MSEFTQALLISGGIFAAVTLRSYGRRAFDRAALVMPVAMVAIFGYLYLHDAPTGTADLVAYAMAIVVGLGFGAVATACTRLERDRVSGIVHTVTGPAFVAVWLLAVVLRVGFVWLVENSDWVRMHFGEFMMNHHISLEAIAPFFVLWALTMVVSRVVALKIREASVSQPTKLAVAI